MLRAPGPNDAEITPFLASIRGSQEQLDAAIVEARSLPTADISKAARIRRYNGLKREIDRMVVDLNRQASSWSSNVIPRMYGRGFTSAATALEVGYDFGVIHKEAVGVLAQDAFDDVATGLQQVSRNFGDKIDEARTFEQLSTTKKQLIRTRGRDLITQQTLTGLEDPKSLAKILADDLWSGGVQITDRAGRSWGMETYTRMLVRTKSAVSYNSGSLGKYAEEGITTVQVFDGVLDDAECARANGQKWSIRYAQQHALAHPNCRRAFAPVPGQSVFDRVRDDERSQALAKRALAALFGASAAAAATEVGWAIPAAVVLVFDKFQGMDYVRRVMGRHVEEFPFLDEKTLEQFVSDVEEYVRRSTEPSRTRLGLITETPSGAPSDWERIRRGVLLDLDADQREANKAKELLAPAAAEAVAPEARQYYDPDNLDSVVNQLVSFGEGADGAAATSNYNLEAHDALRDLLDRASALPGSDRRRVAQFFNSPSGDGVNMLEWALREAERSGAVGDEVDRLAEQLIRDALNDLVNGLDDIKGAQLSSWDDYFSKVMDYPAAVLPRSTPVGDQNNFIAWVRYMEEEADPDAAERLINALGFNEIREINEDTIVRVFRDQITDPQFEGIGWINEDQLDPALIERQLKSIFGDENVGYLGAQGVNGRIYTIKVGNDEFLLKPTWNIQQVPQQGMGGIVSETITQYFAEAMGSPTVPIRAIPADGNGRVWQLMVRVPDSSNLNQVPIDGRFAAERFRPQWAGDVAPADAWRRAALLDILSGNVDGHGGNYLVRDNAYIYKIDNELAFKILFPDDSRRIPLDNGFSTVATNSYDDFISRWLRGEGITLDERPYGRDIVLTDEQFFRIFGGPPDAFPDDARFMGTRIGRNTTAFRNADGEWVIAPGQYIGFSPGDLSLRGLTTGVTPTGGETVHYLKRTESDFVRDLIAGKLDDDILQRTIGQFADFPDGYLDVAVQYSGRSSVEEYAEDVLQQAKDRISLLVDRGFVVLDAETSWNDFGTGLGSKYRVALGERVRLTDEAGQVLDGYVIHMWTDAVGERQLVIIEGLDDIVTRPGEFLPLAQTREIAESKIPAELSTFLDEAIDPNYYRQVRERPAYNYPLGDVKLYEDSAQKRVVKVPQYDNFGVFDGHSVELLEVDASYVDLVDVDGVPFFPEALTQNAEQIITEELAAIPPEYRPRSIRLVSDLLTDSEGTRSVGIFHQTDDRVLELSLVPALEASDDIADIAIASDIMLSDPLAFAQQNLRWDKFREVVRHELGHAVEYGTRQRDQAELGYRIVQEIIEAVPEGTTWNQLNDIILERGLVDEVAEGKTALQTLVEDRADLIDFVVRQQREAEAIAYLKRPGLPDWAEYPKSVLDARRGEVASELLGEAFMVSRNAGSTTVPPPGLPDRLYWGLFRDERTLALINGDIALPDPLVRWSTTRIVAAAPDLRRGKDEFYSASRLIDEVFGLSGDAAEGYTLDIVTGDRPVRGFSVSIEEREQIVSKNVIDRLIETGDDAELKSVIEDYEYANRDLLERDGWFAGGWWDLDEESDTYGQFFLDVSRIFEDDVAAADFGLRESQRAFYDLERFVDHRLDRYDDLSEYVLDRKHIPALRGERKVKGDPVPAVLNKGGAEAQVITPRGDKTHASMRLKDLSEDLQKKITDTFDGDVFAVEVDGKEVVLDSSLDSVTNALRRVLKTAESGYGDTDDARSLHQIILDSETPEAYALRTILEDSPESTVGEALRRLDNFYVDWNQSFNDVADEIGIEVERIAAAAAAMSGSVEANANKAAAIAMARATADNRRLDQRTAKVVRELLQSASDNALDPKNSGKPNPERAAYYLGVKKRVRAGKNFNELEDIIAVFAARAYAAEESGVYFPAPYGWDVYEKARRVLRDIPGVSTFDEIDRALGDSKVRSFYNNILDPKNLLGYGDVTVDFHMGDAALGVIGMNKIKWATPGRYGVSLGFRAVIGEALNILWEEGWGAQVNADSLAELQEVLWAWWRRGKAYDLWGSLPKVTKLS